MNKKRFSWHLTGAVVGVATICLVVDVFGFGQKPPNRSSRNANNDTASDTDSSSRRSRRAERPSPLSDDQCDSLYKREVGKSNNFGYRVSCIKTCGGDAIMYVEKIGNKKIDARLVRVPIKNSKFNTIDFATEMFTRRQIGLRSEIQNNDSLMDCVSSREAVDFFGEGLASSLKQTVECDTNGVSITSPNGQAEGLEPLYIRGKDKNGNPKFEFKPLQYAKGLPTCQSGRQDLSPKISITSVPWSVYSKDADFGFGDRARSGNDPLYSSQVDLTFPNLQFANVQCRSSNSTMASDFADVLASETKDCKFLKPASSQPTPGQNTEPLQNNGIGGSIAE